MRLSDFDFELPTEQIAQEPAPERDGSRLLLVPKTQGPVGHARFSEFPKMLRPGDLLVLNDTRVMPARLMAAKKTGGKVDLLLDRPLDEVEIESGRHIQKWACLLRASKRIADDLSMDLPGGGAAKCLARREEGGFVVRLELPCSVEQYLQAHGQVPLPPYIHRRTESDHRAAADRERYQTIYAKAPGAVAAPTAGLHFDHATFAALKDSGVEIAKVTLHVGPGTFLPVREENLEQHVIHSERYSIAPETVAQIEETKQAEGRVVAVGTTVVRALESAVEKGTLQPGSGLTELFIKPGFDFEIVDALLTNFHLPRSTLLMLVCALAEREHILSAYREAVDSGYRFYSYGDAMFIS